MRQQKSFTNEASLKTLTNIAWKILRWIMRKPIMEAKAERYKGMDLIRLKVYPLDVRMEITGISADALIALAESTTDNRGVPWADSAPEPVSQEIEVPRTIMPISIRSKPTQILLAYKTASPTISLTVHYKDNGFDRSNAMTIALKR
jgi:hypothetical protein